MTPDAWSDADWQDRAAAGRDLGGRHLDPPRPVFPTVNEYRYTVTVLTDTEEHADQVMAERLDCYEEYEDETGARFDYSVPWQAVTP